MASSVLAKMAVEISANSAGLTKSLKSAENSLKGFTGVVSKVATAATVAFAAISFGAIGREIIAITAEFQKFEAVLTNTLGSNSEAKEALENIREFAAKTPFSVQELTASFVKLANQGFKPTNEEMRKLGDLAASTGKGFDQLTEAIIDAQTGEFERLKEFGIRASKSGDQVKFTFKGVQTQTEFTAESIREYLLGLGDLEGVSGSTAAISATLGGKISNLGDSFDGLLLTLGNLTSGPLAGFVDLLGEALQDIQDILTPDKQSTVLETVNDQYVESAKNIQDVNTNLEKLNRLKKIESDAYDDATAKLGDANSQLELSAEQFFKLGKEQATAKIYVEAYSAAIEALTKKQDEFNKKQDEQLKTPLIKELQDRIKHFEELKNQAFSVEGIAQFNNKIKELRDELDLLNAAGSESAFLKNLNLNQKIGIETEIKVPEESIPEDIFPTTLDIDVQPYLDKLAEVAQAQDAFGQGEAAMTEQAIARQEELENRQRRLNDAAQDFGAVVGDSFAKAATGQLKFKDALKQVVGEVLKLFLKQALGGVVAGAAGTAAPPPVILALAAAGMAGISALFSSFGGPTSGGGAGAAGPPRTNVSRVTPQPIGNQGPERMEFVIHGEDLVTLASSQAKKNERRRG